MARDFYGQDVAGDGPGAVFRAVTDLAFQAEAELGMDFAIGQEMVEIHLGLVEGLALAEPAAGQRSRGHGRRHRQDQEKARRNAGNQPTNSQLGIWKSSATRCGV
jgi:hypothetical protein